LYTYDLPFAEVREVKYGDKTGTYWVSSYPFPLAKRDVSLIINVTAELLNVF